MDKSWIELDNKKSKAYTDGIESFLVFAFTGKDITKDEIYCPCTRCVNRYLYKLPKVRIHIANKGFSKSYKIWTYHGEDAPQVQHGSTNESVDDMAVDRSDVRPDMVAMVREGMGFPNVETNLVIDDSQHIEGNTSYGDKIFKRLEEAQKPLYEGCPEGLTELSFIVELLHMKQLNCWSNHSFSNYLQFMRKSFPNAKIPKSYYEANKLTKELGFQYVTWDACPKGCMLFRNESAHLDKCELCNEPRYKDAPSEGQQGKRIPSRQVRYFPLKQRLQRLFWSSHTAPLMRWHAEERINDGVMRHPADSYAWKTFDERNPIFANEIRNIRLGLATDGFNPFNNMSSTHSTWPIVLIPYNVPPWLYMKQPNFILSTLIDGQNAPGDKIDVFLQPLVEELKELWVDGVSTYDVSRKEEFQLRAALLWTINDFPALANLMGWNTKGEFACPWCNVDHQATWLVEGRKFCYWGHRRFLSPRHVWQKQKASFDGKVNLKQPPKKLDGVQLLKQLEDYNIETIYKKEDVIRKRKRDEEEKEIARRSSQKIVKKHNWKKKSIFWELPYWEHNVIRHNLDILHIEKNVCDNVLHTLLGHKTKSKDNLKARRDLKRMKIRDELHTQPRGANMEYMPRAAFTLGNKEKELFLKFLRDVKVPDGYSSNISRCVNLESKRIQGLKTHDNHILMQQLLPIAVRNLLPDHVVHAIIELSNCFMVLCSSVNTIADLEKFEDRVAVMICNLERIFPPSFFDVMEHLPIHLADELLLAGSVLYRWMYPIERYLGTLKGYVRNRARPETSIAKSVLVEECMTFRSRYLGDDVESKSNRPLRNDCGDAYSGRGVGKRVAFSLDQITREQCHRYVLANPDSITPFIQKHLEELSTMYPHKSQIHPVNRLHSQNFPKWFKDHVNNLSTVVRSQLSDEIKSLALGPLETAYRFKSYLVCGFHFRTKEVDIRRKTQNSGVILKAEQMNFSSSRDANPCLGDITFYGQLRDIIEIHYLNGFSHVLFKCDWIDNRLGEKVDKFNFTLVNFNHLMYKGNQIGDEPFILASQAGQVFYIQDNLDPNWNVVVRMTPRERFDKYSTVDEELEVPRIDPFSRQEFNESQDVIWVRHEDEGDVVNASTLDGNGDDDEATEANEDD